MSIAQYSKTLLAVEDAFHLMSQPHEIILLSFTILSQSNIKQFDIKLHKLNSLDNVVIFFCINEFIFLMVSGFSNLAYEENRKFFFIFGYFKKIIVYSKILTKIYFKHSQILPF